MLKYHAIAKYIPMIPNPKVTHSKKLSGRSILAATSLLANSSSAATNTENKVG